ncbi:MAG: hypothetical protein AB7G37_15765 [Solirubrobacteraceae bacterium]
MRRPPSRPFTAILAAMLLALVGPSAAQAFEPLEGVWRIETSTQGEYLIQAEKPGALRMVTIHGNDHCRPDESGFRTRVGERVSIRGTGLDYTWTSVFRFTSTCALDGRGQGIMRVLEAGPDRYRHVACSARPGTGPPQFDAAYRPTSANTNCRFAVRIRAPRTPVTGRSYAKPPATPRCTRRARARGRTARLRVRNVKNEPILSVRVTLRGKTIYRYAYPGKVRRTVRLKLPRKGARLVVRVKTTSGKSFKATKRYRACR